jgi:hypothetical protein
MRRAISYAYRVQLISIGFSIKNFALVCVSCVCGANAKVSNNNKIESNLDQYVLHRPIASARFQTHEVSHG